MKYLLFASFFIISCSTFGQRTDLDSLVRATEIMKNDTLKVDNLRTIGDRLRTDLNDFTKAKKYIEESLRLSKLLKHVYGEFRAMVSLGYVIQNMGSINEANDYFKTAINLFETNDELRNRKKISSEYISVHTAIASNYSGLLNFKEAEKYAFKALALSDKYETGNGLGWITLTQIFYKQQNYADAKVYALKALAYYQKSKTYTGLGRTYTYLGLIETDKGNSKEGIEYYLLALENYKISNNKSGIRLTYYNIALLYVKLEDSEKAIFNLKESLKYSNPGDSQTLYFTNSTLARVSMQKKDHAESIKFAKIALENVLKRNNKSNIKTGYELLYDVYKAAKDSANALLYLQKIITINDSLYSSDMAKNSADLAKKYETEKKEQQIVFLDKENQLSREKLGKEIMLALALQNENELKEEKLKKEILLRAALARENKLQGVEIAQKQVIQLGLERENTLKKSELSTETQLNQSLKLQNNLMLENSKNETLARWLMIFGMFGFTAFGVNYYRNYRRQKADNQQIIKQSEELKILMREVHHRVKNNLQIISAMLRMQARSVVDKSAIEALVNSENRLQTIAMVHEKLYKSENLSGVILKDYLQELMDVLAKQHQSIVPKFHYTIQDNAQLTTNLDTAIPLGLIVNELVTNSFKYAFKELENGEINLSIGKINKDSYQLEIRDNGLGFPDGKLPKTSTSLGLKLVNLFTEQLNGSLKYETDKGSHFTILFKPIVGVL